MYIICILYVFADIGINVKPKNYQKTLFSKTLIFLFFQWVSTYDANLVKYSDEILNVHSLFTAIFL